MEIPNRPSPQPVCKKGEFVFASAFLDHGHINGQTEGLVKAGGELKYVYDADRAKAEVLAKQYPGAKVAASFDEILGDSQIKIVATAAVPCDRGGIGVRAMRAGKDFFSDKPPFTSLAQLDDARRVAKETGRKYFVYYGERLHVECAMFAGELIERGEIGKVVQIAGFGPHKIGKPEARPAWFFQKAKYGGILTDIASHQCEQFLAFGGAANGVVNFARVGNFGHPQWPELEDFGEASFTLDNGVSCYCRVDWFTPATFPVFGDGRTIVLGTDGYIEMRKYIDVATGNGGDQLILVNKSGEQRMSLNGKIGIHYFGNLIRDCLDRTETAMRQTHAFNAAEMSLKAQAMADVNR